MDKKELRRRGKGLLALMLACIMMFGTSMTVLAATTHYLNAGDTPPSLNAGDKLKGGDTIYNRTSSGNLTVIINNSEQGYPYPDSNFCYYFVLPTGHDYEVTEYTYEVSNGNPVNGYNYTVKLKTIPVNSSAGSQEAAGTSQTENTNGGGQPHIHTYTWVTTREATETQDGLEEYKCACGAVDAQAVIPASQMLVKGFCKAVREATPDSRITYDTKDLATMSDKMVACLSERTDITVELTFNYQKTPYRMTIPAGSDYSALLADEDMFYGYFYFADQIGAQIEPVS